MLTLTEAIETNGGTIQTVGEQLRKKLNGEHAIDVKSLLEFLKADAHCSMVIHRALSLQDLGVRCVAKLVTIINEVQDKLLKLAVIFGIKKKKDMGATKNEGHGYEMLHQFEDSKAKALHLDIVDEIFLNFDARKWRAHIS